MITSLIGKTFLPEPTLSDEICGRIYYAVSSCMDIVQTVAKVVRSIFASTLSFIFLGQSPFLNKISLLSWDDVGFSLQMTAYSILGILSPKQAWLKKCESHISNVTSRKHIGFSELMLEDRGMLKSAGVSLILAGQMMESGIRYVASHVRFLAAKFMVALSLENARFVKILGNGAYRSAEFASKEIHWLSQSLKCPLS